MKNLIEKIKVIFRHNQFLSIVIMVCLVFGVWIFGCNSTTQSPFNPDKKVTRVQLLNEWESYSKDVEIAITDLDRQDLFKQKLTEIGIAFAQGGTIDPVGAGITLLGILGIGAVADNRKKDSLIKTLQNGSSQKPTN